MPDLLRRVNAVELPWMCPEIRETSVVGSPFSKPDRVAVLGGASGVAAASLARAAFVVAGDARLELAAPAGLPDIQRGAVVPFGYTGKEFKSCSGALCRPAMGTIHDCIAYGVPMVCIHERGNAEMAHNGRTVQAEGLGIYLGPDPAEKDIKEALRTVLGGSARAAILNAMKMGNKDGYQKAASWLAQRLGAGGDLQAGWGPE